MFYTDNYLINDTIYESTDKYKHEKDIYRLWDYSLIKKELKTLSNKDLKIIFPGHQNHFSGPDFLNASILINNQIIDGDIEIHVNDKDWYLHKHHKNPEFNKVILHVCLNHNSSEEKTLKQNNQSIEILSLKYYLLDDDFDKIVNTKYCRLFAEVQPQWLSQNLSMAGIKHFMQKVSFFENELSHTSLDGLLYKSILKSLGYSRNQSAFEKYTELFTWNYYKQLFKQGLSKNQFQDILIKNMQLEKNYFNWEYFRVRPCNHPEKRLLQISHFLYEALETSLCTEFYNFFSFILEKTFDYSTPKNNALNKIRLRIYNKLCKSDFNSLGKSRADLIIVNIFLPILMVYAKKINNLNLQTLCYSLFMTYPRLENNFKNNKLNQYMTHNQINIANKKAVTQFGMQKIYKTNCISHHCKQCSKNFKFQ